MNEDLAKKIGQILYQYFLECQGNRINQWAWGPLENLILETIKNHKSTKKEVVNDAKK